MPASTSEATLAITPLWKVRSGIPTTIHSGVIAKVAHATLEGSFRYTNNDLRHQVAAGPTIFKVPEVKMSFRQLPHLGRAIFDAGYRERRQTGPFLDTPFNTGTSKNVRIPYADVSMPISTTLFTIGYEHRFNNDYRDSTQTTNVNRVSFSIRSILDLKGWQFSPLFRSEIEREYFLSAVGRSEEHTSELQSP